MKKIFLFALAAAFLFTNCVQEEMELTLKTATAVATMESELTKSNATDEGYFTWSENDQIAIQTTSGVVVGTLTDGKGSPNATFAYSLTGSQTLTNYAMYPFNEGHSTDGNTLTFVMPASYNLGEVVSNTNAPMLAVPGNQRNSTANFDFNHLGGVFRIKFVNAPAGTSKFTLSLGGKKINGTFEADLTQGTPVLVTGDAAEGENTTTLNFTPLASAQDITLFVPVPTGNYVGISAKLYKGETLLGSWDNETAANNVGRRALVLMNPITFGSGSGNIENQVNVATEQQLKAAVENNGTVTLTEDIALKEAIVIGGPVTKSGESAVKVTLDLNGKTITAANGDAIVVTNGAEVTITGNGTVQVLEDANGCAVWAHHNGKVTIENGTFSTNDDKDGDRCDCIYAGSSADSSAGTITINGGTFKYDGQNDEGHKFLLNKKDNTQSVITVYGGTFHKFNPAVSYGEPDSPVNFVAEGYSSSTSDNGATWIVAKK